MNVDISSEAVERLAKDCDWAQRDHNQFTREAHLHFDCAATLRAQAERIKELEAGNAAGLRREKDANERAMKHLRRAEKAEIASKNHAAFSHEWRERAEKAEAENGILRTEKHADAEAIASARNDALREALSHKWLCFHKCDEEIEVVNADDITALIEGDTND
ncbi:hypothetical protein [Sulfitobacter sp. PS-8MA]|uniref:hypothetical protein n=1 Tax=Sulfitobacter sp. PS-8MA TaxID=3237707 RepID=UPI0034C6CE4E